MRQTYTARVPGLEPAAIGCGAFVRMTVHATVLLAALSTKASARFTDSLRKRSNRVKKLLVPQEHVHRTS